MAERGCGGAWGRYMGSWCGAQKLLPIVTIDLVGNNREFEF